VISYTVTSVTIHARALAYPKATVSFVVTYTSGQQWASALGLIPYKDVDDLVGYLHLDCWGSEETLDMFAQVVPDIPLGAEYSSPDRVMSYCKDHAGHIITM
jgi:hypothetical protein